MCMCVFMCQSSCCYLWCYTISSSLHTNGFSVITFAYYMVSRCCMLSLNFIWVKITRVWSTQFSPRWMMAHEKSAVVNKMVLSTLSEAFPRSLLFTMTYRMCCKQFKQQNCLAGNWDTFALLRVEPSETVLCRWVRKGERKREKRERGRHRKSVMATLEMEWSKSIKRTRVRTWCRDGHWQYKCHIQFALEQHTNESTRRCEKPEVQTRTTHINFVAIYTVDSKLCIKLYFIQFLWECNVCVCVCLSFLVFSVSREEPR